MVGFASMSDRKCILPWRHQHQRHQAWEAHRNKVLAVEIYEQAAVFGILQEAGYGRPADEGQRWGVVDEGQVQGGGACM